MGVYLEESQSQEELKNNLARFFLMIVGLSVIGFLLSWLKLFSFDDGIGQLALFALTVSIPFFFGAGFLAKILHPIITKLSHVIKKIFKNKFFLGFKKHPAATFIILLLIYSLITGNLTQKEERFNQIEGINSARVIANVNPDYPAWEISANSPIFLKIEMPPYYRFFKQNIILEITEIKPDLDKFYVLFNDKEVVLKPFEGKVNGVQGIIPFEDTREEGWNYIKMKTKSEVINFHNFVVKTSFEIDFWVRIILAFALLAGLILYILWSERK